MDVHAYMASSDSDSDEEDSDAEPGAPDRGGQNGSGDAPPEDDKKAAKLEKREKERERLRALLLGDVMNTGKKGGGENESEDEDEEMEITFNTGLNDLGEKMEQKRKEKEQLVSRRFELLEELHPRTYCFASLSVGFAAL